MYDNVSKKTSIRPYNNLNKSTKNQIILVEEFMLEDNESSAKHEKITHQTMINEIRLACRLG